MERAIYFTKFRNLGFNQSERLVLNHSLEKGKIGNLVIIVGANNSGKSNILDGLTALSNKSLSERDITTLSYKEDDRKPQLSLVVKDEKKEYTYRITKGEKDFILYPPLEKEIEWKFVDDLQALVSSLSHFLQYCRNYGINRDSITGEISRLINLINSNNENKEEIKNKAIKIMEEYFKIYSSGNGAWIEYYRRHSNSIFAQEIHNNLSKKDELSILEDKFKNEYGINFLPQIVNYQEVKIKNTDIMCLIDNLPSNKFFNTVFSKIGITIEEIQNTYKVFRTLNNKGALTTLQKKINNLLNHISKDFNELYFADNDQYKFEISLESNNIYFSLFRGSNDLSLDYQSTGFRWFFNLYFNLLAKTNLKPGDIIIMDEPATNLHIKGKMELRKFFKEFAIKNDLTLLITTHDPFLIDLDYLDELRVVSMRDNISSICNDFTTVDIEDPDSLKPIKSALTVSNHVLLDPDKPVVFVEGITDYNYLVGFKKLLNIHEDIVFLPIQAFR